MLFRSYKLSILYLLVYICESQSPNSSHHPPPPAFHPSFPFVYFCFYFHNSRNWVKKDLAVIYVTECSIFSSKSSIVSGLTFRPLIHFEFIFVCGVRKCSNFILLHVAVQFSPHHLLKRLSFLHCMFLPLLS